MTPPPHLMRLFHLTIPLGGLMAVSSLAGMLDEGVYARETATYAAQGVGQDIVNLCLIVPVLLLSGHQMSRGSRAWQMVWFGGMIYSAYAYVVYCFGLHFNSLFLLYVAILGLAFHILMSYLLLVDGAAAKEWYERDMPRRRISIFLVVVAVLFYILWLGDVVAALLAGTVPATVEETGLPTNPVHVLDMAVILPALLYTALLLERDDTWGYVLAPPLIAFIILMTAAIGGMIAVMKLRGFEADLAVSVVFAIIASISLLVLRSITQSIRMDEAAELDPSRPSPSEQQA